MTIPMLIFRGGGESGSGLDFHGSQQGTGLGPFTPSASPQLFEYIGSDPAVVVELPPSPLAGPPPTSGFLFAVANLGTGGATVVPEYLGVPIDATAIAIGEVRTYMWESVNLGYIRFAISQVPSGGGFVNPMPNATALQGLDTSAVARDLVVVTAGDVAVFGGAAIPTAVNTVAAGGSLQVNSVSRFSWSDVLFGPLQDAARTLGSAALRWLSVHVSSFLAIGTNPAATGSVRVPRTDTMLVGRNQANTNDVQHLGSTTLNNFRVFSIGDSLVLAAGTAPGTTTIECHVSQAGNAFLPVTGVAGSRPGLGSPTLGWAALYLVSPDATVWEVSVDNTGTLVVV
jgi:hypothetical protein